MISMATSTTQALVRPQVSGSPDPVASRRAASRPADLPSAADVRASAQTQKKAMASRKLQAVRDQMKALSLMVKIDPKSALRLSSDLAKALKAAIKDYVDAGGRNVSDGEMAMLRRRASEAREAASMAEQATPPEPAAGEALADTTMDAEVRRGQAAYAVATEVAEGRGDVAESLERAESTAAADRGFFQQVKEILGALKKAREDIKADWGHPRKPDDEDWKVSDQALEDLEREIDFAPTGAPEPEALAPVSTRV